MALNNSQEPIVDNRRREVARLRLRGLSQREILSELEKGGIVNPDTGKPFSLGTINADLQELHTDWRQQAMEDTHSHRGRVLAELREVRRKAWKKEDLAMVQRGLAQETAVLGLQRPSAPEDILHYHTRSVMDPTCIYVGKLITAGYGRNVTADEKAAFIEKYEDWFHYANMLLEKSEEEPEQPANDDAQEQDEKQVAS